MGEGKIGNPQKRVVEKGPSRLELLTAASKAAVINQFHHGPHMSYVGVAAGLEPALPGSQPGVLAINTTRRSLCHESNVVPKICSLGAQSCAEAKGVHTVCVCGGARGC